MKHQLKKLSYLLFSAFLLSSKSLAQQTFTSKQLKEDFTILRKSLEEAHPSLYRYSSKAELDESFNQIYNNLNHDDSELIFFRKIYPALANIGDGHLKFHRQNKPDDHCAFHEQGYFPIKLFFKDGRAYVKEFNANYPLLKMGAEIKSINRQPVHQIITFLLKNIISDSKITTAKYQELNTYFAGYYATFIDNPNKFDLTYGLANGKTKTLSIKSVSKTLLSKPRENADSLSLNYVDSLTAIMRIPIFQAKVKGKSFIQFLEKSFDEINRKKIKKLLIDLRGNEGGIDDLGINLYAHISHIPFYYYEKLTVANKPPYSFKPYAYIPPEVDQLKNYIVQKGNELHFVAKNGLSIQQPKQNPFKGAVYILQDGKTFSVAAEFTAIAKSNKRAVILGEESGGAYDGNTSGTFAMITLPNTKLGLDIPLLAYHMKVEHKETSKGGVKADQEITMDIDDFIVSKDLILEKAINKIKTM